METVLDPGYPLLLKPSELLSESDEPSIDSGADCLFVHNIEESAWTEHQANLVVKNPECSQYTSTTENSVCANNGSFDETGFCELFDISRKDYCKGEYQNKPGSYSYRIRNIQRRKRRSNNVLTNAWKTMKKIYLKYLSAKKTKKVLKQEILMRNRGNTMINLKEYYKVLKILVRIGSRKRISPCICRGDGKDAGHNDYCMTNSKLLKQFLAHESRRIILQLPNLSKTRRKILIEMSVLLRKKIRVSFKNYNNKVTYLI